jgi:hypothetical protein
MIILNPKVRICLNLRFEFLPILRLPCRNINKAISEKITAIRAGMWLKIKISAFFAGKFQFNFNPDSNENIASN